MTTITPEPGQVAVVLGMEDGQISRQLFASPQVDATLDDDHFDIPFHHFLTSTLWYAWIRRRISPLTWPSGTRKSFLGRQAVQPREKEPCL